MSSKATAYWNTAISDVDASDVHIRGYALREVIGRLPFAAACFLLIRSRLASTGEARMMDALLCAVLDYALSKPGTVAARYCVSGNPNMAAGLATAMLAAGEYTLAPDQAGQFILASFEGFKSSGKSQAEAAAELVKTLRAEGRRVPGFGHPNFRVIDPRAARLRSIAVDTGNWGEKCGWYEAVHAAFIASTGKSDLVINDVGMMAAIMADMDFTPAEMTGIALLSTIPGVIAHVSEEMQTGKRIRVIPDETASFARERKDLAKDLAAAGWDNSERE
jgi:citrate synthase